MGKWPSRVAVILLAGVFIAALFGAVVFFPVNIGNTYTCLFHRLVVGEAAHSLPTAALLDRYIVPFGLLWWSSLFLSALTGYTLLKVRKRYRKRPIPPGFVDGDEKARYEKEGTLL